MKNKTILLIIAVAFLSIFFVGCDDENAARFNESSAENPQFIVTMPDGRSLYCIEIENTNSSNYHFIYYFGTNDTKTISVNHYVQSGKTGHNNVSVLN